MIAPDASAVVETLLQTERGRRLEAWLFAPEETLHVPHLIDIEVAHALRRAWLQGLIDGEARKRWTIWRSGLSFATPMTSSYREFGCCVTT